MSDSQFKVELDYYNHRPVVTLRWVSPGGAWVLTRAQAQELGRLLLGAVDTIDMTETRTRNAAKDGSEV